MVSNRTPSQSIVPYDSRLQKEGFPHSIQVGIDSTMHSSKTRGAKLRQQRRSAASEHGKTSRHPCPQSTAAKQQGAKPRVARRRTNKKSRPRRRQGRRGRPGARRRPHSAARRRIPRAARRAEAGGAPGRRAERPTKQKSRPGAAARGAGAESPLSGQRRPILPRASPSVLSAMEGLTAGFGMGPGVPPPPWPLTRPGAPANHPRGRAPWRPA